MSGDAGLRSVLFAGADAEQTPADEEPECFHDLHLDQVVEAVVAGRDEYDLRPFFFTPLWTVEAVAYRQGVLDDLRRDEVRACVDAFAQTMQAVRRRLTNSQRLRRPLQQQRWFLDAARTYGEAVRRSAGELADVELTSDGMRGVREDLEELVSSAAFGALEADARRRAPRDREPGERALPAEHQRPHHPRDRLRRLPGPDRHAL